jgi:hypothetical protein
MKVHVVDKDGKPITVNNIETKDEPKSPPFVVLKKGHKPIG